MPLLSLPPFDRKRGPLKRTEEGIKMRVQRKGGEGGPPPSNDHTTAN